MPKMMDVLRTPHPFPDIAASHLCLCFHIDTVGGCQIQDPNRGWATAVPNIQFQPEAWLRLYCPEAQTLKNIHTATGSSWANTIGPMAVRGSQYSQLLTSGQANS